MQGNLETAFDAIYLTCVTVLGILMLRNHRGRRQYLLSGIMAVTLGAGDAFHLVPRAYALLTDGLANHTAALGIGKFITSITMTLFYLLLYHVWRARYHVQGRYRETIALYALAALRIGLCLFPQNAWTSAAPPLHWGIYRHMWLTIVLSFAFYIPVVLFGDSVPLVGILMIPKTMAYVWTVLICYLAMRKDNKEIQP